MKALLIASSILLLSQVCQCRPRYDTYADVYSSMGDIDWGKRAYGYHSMADTDWGWKKRSDEGSDDDILELTEDPDMDKRTSKVVHSYYTPYKYRQPYALASSSYMPYKSHDEPQSSVDAAAAAGKSKRNLASLARGNELPSRFRSRRFDTSMDRADPMPMSPLSYWARQYNLINQLGENEDEMQRATRSGIGALARMGGVRPYNHAGHR